MNAALPRDDPAAIPPLWEKRLLKIEARIDSSEGDGLKARWEFGRELLAQREGKLLPRGLLDAVAKRVGVGRSELHHRMTFAERYPTEDELRNAVTQFPSWHQMTNQGIRQHREPKPKPTEAALALRRAGRLAEKFAALSGPEIGEPERAAMDSLRAVLTHLYSLIGGGNGEKG